jgi:tRNA nucleotidyltransferase (CCA-adding enzyme)
LDLVLGEDRPVATLSRMEELKLLASIQPQLFWKQKIAAAIEAVLFADLDPNWPLPTSLGHIPLRRALAYLVWLGSLPPAAAISTAVCLRLNGEFISCLRETFSILPDLPLLMSLTPSQVVRRLEPIPLAALYVPGHFFPSVEVRLVLSNFISNWRHVRPTVSGKTLLAFGIPPGPNFHHLLEALRAGRLDGKINSDEEELSFLHNLIREL